jgi:hypothetical protein
MCYQCHPELVEGCLYFKMLSLHFDIQSVTKNRNKILEETI